MIRGTLFELHCVGTEKCPAGVRVFTACRYCVIALHSVLSSTEQAAAFSVAAPGVRKIVIATNIAETGITIPDVSFVIDSGKVKENR